MIKHYSTPVAFSVPFDNTVTGQLAADNVQDAIDELTGSVDIQTPNRFAGFDASGDLESINNWVRNSYGGVQISQTPTPTDIGSTQSFIYNNKSIVVAPTNNLTNTYLYFDLDQIDLGGTFNYLGVTGRELSISQTGVNAITEPLVALFPRVSLGVGGVGSTSTTDTVILANIRLSGAHTATTINGIESQVSMDGLTTTTNANAFLGSTYIGGIADYAYGLNQSVQIDGTLNQTAYGVNLGMTATFPGSSTQNAIGFNLGFTGDVVSQFLGLNLSYVGTIGGSTTFLNSYHEGAVSGSVLGFYYNRNGANLGSATILAASLNSASPTTGTFKFISFVNDGAISDFGTGSFINQNGAVTKSWTGYGVYVNANVGDGTGQNAFGYDVSFQSHVIDGSLWLFNANNSSTVAGQITALYFNNTANFDDGFYGASVTNSGNQANNTDITGYFFNNQGTGYRFIGFSAVNNQDFTEEIRGLKFDSSGDARTLTAIDLILSGNITDDAQGIRVNVSSLTSSSATTHVRSGTFEGGLFQTQSAYSPFASFGVDIGNNLSVTCTIPAGTPLTGTDQFLTFFQSNLIVDDNISTGPFGLDTNMYGLVSQVAVATGKTVPLLRTMLMGTSVPLGSGGTITEHVVLEILGLPSFGGSVTCPTKVGIQDSILLGQAFSDGATTNSWFIRVRDEFVENHLPRLAINTTSLKNSTNVRLEVRNGHIKSDQTTAPTIAANANAGTGATASLAGATDTSGSITLTTGSAAWAAGPQADITFNVAYNVAPKIVLFPREANAAAAGLAVYVTRSTTGFSVEFATPDVAATTYEWDYVIIETY